MQMTNYCRLTRFDLVLELFGCWNQIARGDILHIMAWECEILPFGFLL